jgi:hypothetical protein
MSLLASYECLVQLTVKTEKVNYCRDKLADTNIKVNTSMLFDTLDEGMHPC